MTDLSVLKEEIIAGVGGFFGRTERAKRSKKKQTLTQVPEIMLEIISRPGLVWSRQKR
jgi:hypothetical protein